MQIFTSLTNLFGTGPISPDTYAVARRKSVIDCVRDDLDNLMRVNMSAVGQEEASRLGRSSQPDGQDIVPAQCNADTATKLGLTQESVQAGTGGHATCRRSRPS